MKRFMVNSFFVQKYKLSLLFRKGNLKNYLKSDK